MTKILIAYAMIVPLWIAIIVCGFGYGWSTDLPLWMDCVFSAYFSGMTAVLICGIVEITRRKK